MYKYIYIYRMREREQRSILTAGMKKYLLAQHVAHALYIPIVPSVSGFREAMIAL